MPEVPFQAIIQGEKADLCFGSIIIRDDILPSRAIDMAMMLNEIFPAWLQQKGWADPNEAYALKARLREYEFRWVKMREEISRLAADVLARQP